MVGASFLDLRLGDFLDRIAAPDGGPRGGSAAAIGVAMAAGLVEMASRLSAGWEDGPRTAEKAEAIRARVAPLAQADAQAYEEFLSARALPEELELEVREVALTIAVSRASALPLMIAESGAEAAELAAFAAEHAAPGFRRDVAAAALLAEAGARAAAHLVRTNLGTTEDDDRVVRARELAAHATDCARRALAATSPG